MSKMAQECTGRNVKPCECERSSLAQGATFAREYNEFARVARVITTLGVNRERKEIRS